MSEPWIYDVTKFPGIDLFIRSSTISDPEESILTEQEKEYFREIGHNFNDVSIFFVNLFLKKS